MFESPNPSAHFKLNTELYLPFQFKLADGQEERGGRGERERENLFYLR